MPETLDDRTMLAAHLRAAIRDVPDFPRPGILFKDVMPLVGDARLFAAVTRAMAAPFRDVGVTHVAGVESRGFVFGAPIAQHLGAGFVPLRKPGKLPGPCERVAYALEYGSDAVEAQVDACGAGHVLIVDDVLATGGTAGAACRLVETIGGTVVGCAFLLELAFLHGRRQLDGRAAHALLQI